MRKIIFIFFSFLLFLPFFSGVVYAVPGDNCSAVYTVPPYVAGGRGVNVEPDPSAATDLCGPINGDCDMGEYCKIVCRNGAGFQVNCTEGRTYNGDCTVADFCCAATGDGCISGVIGCCDALAKCSMPLDPSATNGECVICGEAGDPCATDASCCQPNRDGKSQACFLNNVGGKQCGVAPPPPAECVPGQIANGEICDYALWEADDFRCDLCASGETTVDINGNTRCEGLATGEACTNSCACETDTCNGGVCSVAGSCINDFVSTGCTSGIPCCSSIDSTPARCGGPSNGDRCVPSCTIVPAGATCTNTDGCCYATTGLVCSAGKCAEGAAVGVECTDTTDTCAPPGCFIGEICRSGQCGYSSNCISLYKVIPYKGPIIGFTDLLATVYMFMYPVGIALGLLFIAKAGYTIMLSEGNPAKISEGKEELTSAVLGTLFILLSLVILRVIIRALLGATI